VYLELTEFDKCIQDCNEAIKIDPAYVKSYIRKGNAELSSSKTKESISTFEKALTLDKENLEIQTLLAEAR
jgi:stress-induced-phosphoprotein 1